mgnify:CR=1 FL=1
MERTRIDWVAEQSKLLRGIADSLTPSWEQIGAVWLPLPHLLNMLPVQIDATVWNERALGFWRSLGFQDYAISMELKAGQAPK